MLSSNNVTVRRKTKTKRHISHQENAILDSFPTSKDESPVVCRKLNDDFEHAENISNLGSFRGNDSQGCLEHEWKTTKQEDTGEEIELSVRDCGSNEQVSLETTLHSDSGNSAKTERCSEKHTAEEAITSNCKGNKSEIFTTSFSPVTNVQLQSVILRVSSIIENNNDGNVFEPKGKYNALSTNVKQNNSNTFASCDGPLKSFNCLNNGGDIIRSCDDESTTSNKCNSHQIIKHSESTNFEHGTAVCLDVKTDFKVSDENAPEFDRCNTDSVSSFIDSQLKADFRKELLLSCRPSGSDAVKTDALLTNKGNGKKPESKKKVIILSSDSDSDSVWQDALDFDDSDCGKYDISLSSRLGENSSNKRSEKTRKEIKTDFSSTTKLKYVGYKVMYVCRKHKKASVEPVV